MPTKRDLSRRIADLGADGGPESDHVDRELFGLYPEGPERREAKTASIEPMRAALLVSEAALPDDRREAQHARLDRLHEQFPDAVDERRDEAVVETALQLL